MWAKTIEGQYAFAPSLCGLRKFHVTGSQNTRDQIASDRKSKRAYQIVFCAFHSFLVEVQNECWPFAGEKCLRMHRDKYHLVDFRQSHWLGGKIPANCCQDVRRNGSFFVSGSAVVLLPM